VVRALARERTGDEPMFLALDKQRPYTYSCLRADMKHYLGRAGLDDSNTPHGLRVEGYNLSRDGNGIMEVGSAKATPGMPAFGSLRCLASPKVCWVFCHLSRRELSSARGCVATLSSTLLQHFWTRTPVSPTMALQRRSRTANRTCCQMASGRSGE